MTVADYDPTQFTDNKLNAGASRPASPVIPDNTYVKSVISSTEIELGQKATFSSKKVISDRNGDARNLLLSNRARIDTKPELEIVADDVRCTHGATISNLQEEELFSTILLL